MSVFRRPDPSEAPEWMSGYIGQTEGSDARSLLEQQASETIAFFRRVTEAGSQQRYAPDKWSIRQVLNHVSDTERVFAYRAMWFARELGKELPGMDQDIAAAAAAADRLPWAEHLADFAAVRGATLTLFRQLPEEAWDRGGLSSGHPVTVRALAFVIVGHLAHHLKVLEERYGL